MIQFIKNIFKKKETIIKTKQTQIGQITTTTQNREEFDKWIKERQERYFNIDNSGNPVYNDRMIKRATEEQNRTPQRVEPCRGHHYETQKEDTFVEDIVSTAIGVALINSLFTNDTPLKTIVSPFLILYLVYSCILPAFVS